MLPFLNNVVEYLRSITGSGLLFIILSTYVISFISNCIPYLTVPYLAIIFFYTSLFSNNIELVTIIILISSLGAATGKVIVYLIGKSLRRLVIGKVSEQDIELFNKLADKGIFFAIFVFAATPLPDDVLYIIVGALKYSPLRFFAACLAGKIVITSFVAFSGEAIGDVVPPGLVIILSIAITVLVILFMRRIDWEKLVRSMIEDGAHRAIMRFISNPREFLKQSSGSETPVPHH
ncbi:MAG: VTT domain-containing protein [Crenarchaeota archaeon]|nr:VTT domain-containing protein [Thermoproteota archaeon]